jgi:dehydrogenase/reductase SDR family protein 12
MTAAERATMLLANSADALLEASVAGSFSRLGFEVRSRLLPEFTRDPGGRQHGRQQGGRQQHGRQQDGRRLDGRTVLITGATSGIGLAAATALAGLGANIHLLARNAERAERAVRRIAAAADHGHAHGRETAHGEIGYGVADLDDLDSVRAFAAGFASWHNRLDVVIHNAGAVHQGYQRTADGLERTAAGQVVAPFLVTTMLLGLLSRSAPARVITVSSGGMYTRSVDVAGLDTGPNGYRGVAAYALAKRAQVALNAQWAARTAGTGIAFHAMHPGWVGTPGIAGALPGFSRVMGPALRTAEQGADTIVWLASADPAELGSGGFWHDRRRRPVYRFPGARPGRADADQRLWDWAAAHAGIQAASAANPEPAS